MTHPSQPHDGSAYFLYHSIGQYDGKAQDSLAALSDFTSVWGANDDEQWGMALGVRQKFIDGWRRLINAPQGTLTTTENVTAALHSLIGGLPDKMLRGKRVLVAADCFPSLHFMLTGMAEQHGFTLDTVPLRQGAAWLDDEDMIAAWGADVGLALLTWVSSTSSHRIDLEALVAHGRAQGSVIGIDITQAAGLLPFDVSDPAVDFTISTSLKWLCGTPGAGILHVAAPLALQCEPELRGWFSQPDPFSWDLDRFEFAPDARRFDHGTPAIMANVASLPALEWHSRQDMGAMLAHNRTLTGMMIEAVDDLGLHLVTPRPEHQRGGSIMVTLPKAVPAGALLEQLRTHAVFADARSQTLRLSPGILTTQEGVEKLLQSLRHAI